MTRVVRSGDCGNSPKNALLEAFAIGLARRQAKLLLGRVTDDVRWNVVGVEVIDGKRAFAEALERSKPPAVAKLTILRVISHGRAGSVNGTLQFADGTRAEFCDVFVFGSARGIDIKEITTYVVPVS